ncbi:MAG: TonB-dependent receptor, partial [Candidatus Marinimicrobia bacterium]|nr:TonB-dependent receptor [Candidatus Neomarinimicrobiota bacterium]
MKKDITISQFTKCIIVIFIAISSLFAESTAILKGHIQDEKGSPLAGANVILKENYAGTAADLNGDFTIRTKPGDYTLEITFIGFEKFREKINLNAGETLTKQVNLKISYFEIGGIIVVAEKELLPSEATTKTRISSGEIEHVQASSLSDVLKLVPGQRFDNPGLQDLKQASIRTSSVDDKYSNRNAAFGTQVIVDNVPVSNNANMQIDSKVNSSTAQWTTEKSGIDLRQIPADNIEEIEVIRGIPSAKYGDLSSGIIHVKTKSESVQQRFKYKYNLQNQELNINGGFKIADQFFNYNANYARSTRDIRIEDYGYTRVSGQVSHVAKLFKNLYTVDNRLYMTRTFDEQGLREGDLYQTEKYNRDYIIRYNHQSRFIITPKQKLDISYSMNLDRQNSYVKKLISSDNTYISDRMTEGTQEGHYFQSAISKFWVKGKAWNQYFSAEYSGTMNTWNIGHRLIAGVSYRHEKNNGPGRIFDPNVPPSLSSILRDRPRSYDGLPALKISSGYVEDQIAGKLFVPVELNIGLRYEQYGSETGAFPKNNGAFLNPRFNAIVSPTENSQLRFGYGTTSKAPSLAMLFPNPIYFDLADINRFTGDSTSLVVVSTYIYDRENKNLKGFQQIKRELSYDQKVGGLGFTLTGYSNTTFNGFASTIIRPIFLYKYDYPNWPDLTGKTISDSVYTTYSVEANSQNTYTRGLEFSVQTNPFTPLKMKLRVEAAYNYTAGDLKGYEYSDTYLRDTSLNVNVKPFWNVVNPRSENLLVN